MTPSEGQIQSFEAQPLDLTNRRKEMIVRIFLGGVTAILILPVMIILGVLIVKGSPVISWDFFFDEPRNGMTEGGIFPALLGTLWLVGVAMLASVPLGIAAAVYLSEYAPDNTLTRIINRA